MNRARRYLIVQHLLLAAGEFAPRNPPLSAVLDYGRRVEPPTRAEEVREVLGLTLRQALAGDDAEEV